MPKKQRGCIHYIISQVILDPELLPLEELLQRTLLLAVDVVELVLTLPVLQGHGDIKRSARRDGTTNTDSLEFLARKNQRSLP